MLHHSIRLSFAISIHTPLAGSDRGVLVKNLLIHDFNPHSPCGERRGFNNTCLTNGVFQSTLPLRGATENLDYTL